MNSQSGKGGVAYIMKTEHSLDLPDACKSNSVQVVQQLTDSEGGEVSPAEMWSTFQHEYLPKPDAPWGRFSLVKHDLSSEVDGDTYVNVVLVDNGEEVTLSGHGNGPIAAFCDALGSPWG